MPKETNKSTLSTIDKPSRLQQSTRTARAKATAIMKALENSIQKCISPLSVLESMYEVDSDEEMAEVPPVNCHPQQSNSSHAIIDANPASAQPSASTSVPISTSTAKKRADELLKNIDTPPLQPIIPKKRHEKPDVPNIVGCAECPKVPENKNCRVFKGDDYGITSKTNVMPDNGDCENNKPRFYSSGYNLCKSVVNARSNEIAERQSVNKNSIHVESKSDDTVVNEVNHCTNRFSPQPSTSKDNKTISKNDLKLHGFLNNHIIEKDEPPCEIIDIDDDDSDTPVKDVKTKPNVCVKSKIVPVIEVDSDVNKIKTVNKISDNRVKKESVRSVQVNESSIKVVENNLNSLNGNIIIDEIDLTNVDVNDLISQNKSLVDKYNKTKTLNVIKILGTDVAVSAPVDNMKSDVTEKLTNQNNVENENTSLEIMEPPCTKPFLGTCPICLDNLSESTIASTTCGHLFCLDCIQKAMKPRYKKCPTCRKRLTCDGYHKIYLQ